MNRPPEKPARTELHLINLLLATKGALGLEAYKGVVNGVSVAHCHLRRSDSFGAGAFHYRQANNWSLKPDLQSRP